MEFLLHLVGGTDPPPDKVMQAGNNVIVRDLSFVMMGDLSTITIGAETITAENLGYEGALDVQQHLDENGVLKFAIIQVNEIYYIYDGETPRGTLEIKALGTNKVGTGANFVGKGTGEFEELVIKGVSDPEKKATSMKPIFENYPYWRTSEEYERRLKQEMLKIFTKSMMGVKKSVELTNKILTVLKSGSE